ncbi:DUF3820 family protein [Corallincola platygyrae]|uniref:DUF3820 family protein n=1 Tax=Corallincola platygyrae TaxID=1193278 RepID=A0ABW4XJ60_9GAMM
MDPVVLKKLCEFKMPFGKYAGRVLIDLPEPYMMWFARQGYPKGELGELLALVYEIKLEGLEGFVKQAVRRTQ